MEWPVWSGGTGFDGRHPPAPNERGETMSRTRVGFLLAGAALIGVSQAPAHGLTEAPATLVAVSVQIDGGPASLYPAPDGSGRYYLEARAGGRYSVSLANRSGERVGVVLTVDGLNAISGERDKGRGRMYVLDPWQGTSVQGWRTSLQEVRQFTFVDERRSYATRTGQANEKMGWIEVAVYRERRALAQALPRADSDRRRPYPIESQENRAPAGAPAAEAPSTRDESEASAKLEGDGKRRSYPGTGWGQRTHDPVVLVSFDPEPEPRERIALCYEYRSALVALGVLPPRTTPPDRLWQRDRAEPGFAQPPRW
jgi:hypothetical protein